MLSSHVKEIVTKFQRIVLEDPRSILSLDSGHLDSPQCNERGAEVTSPSHEGVWGGVLYISTHS